MHDTVDSRHSLVAHMNGRPLQPTVDAEFVLIVGRLRMHKIAEGGSALLAQNDK